MTSGIPWSSEESQLLAMLWPEGGKEELLRAFPDRSWRTLREKAHELALPARTFERRPRGSPVNPDFFATWSESMAYVFGFWFADGWMSQPGKDATVRFVSKDQDHLALIRDLMDSQHRIYARRDACYTLVIGSQYLWRGLSRQGGIPAKSLVATMPDVPCMYRRPFVRGLVDGDGYVTWDRPTRPRPVIGILGNGIFLERVAVLIDEETGVGVAPIYEYEDTWPRVRYTGIRAKVLALWLYAGMTMALERKAVSAREFAAWEPSKYGWKSQAVLTPRMQQVLEGRAATGD